MQLRPQHAAGRPNARDGLAAADLLAGFDEQSRIVGVGAHPTALVLDQQQVAETAQLVAGISDNAVFGRSHRGSLSRQNVDAVVVKSTGARPESHDHPSEHGP